MYESSTSAVVDALTSSSSTIFNESTIERILSLTTQGTTDTTVSFEQVTASTDGQVTVTAGTEVAIIGSSASQQTTIDAPVNVPVVIFEGLGGVNATFNDGQTTVQSAAGVVDRVVVHSAGADNIVIEDGKNSQITVGANDTVVAGAGNDTVIAGFGDSTVVGGTGYTIVDLGGDDSDYEVTVVDGHAIVTNTETGVTTDVSNAQFVQLDNGEALVFAKDSKEAAVSTLYETTFGRAADALGLQYWFDRVNDGASLSDIADAFVNSAEFDARPDLNDEAFLESLYQNTFGRAADDAGLAYWTGVLENGGDRGDVIESFANTAAAHLDGTLEGEATIVGTITIVPGIV